MKTVRSRTDRYNIIGIIVIIFGYLISLNPYWWVFGTPIVFLIGVIIIWVSKSKLLTKILFTTLPIILWLPGFWALCYFATNHTTPVTFLIPENFRGKITIYYGEPCGQDVKKENGRYIYEVPSTGVIIVKNPEEDGIIDWQYYFINSKKQRMSKIGMLIQQDFNESYTLEKNKHEPSRDKVAVFIGGTGSGEASDFKYSFQELYVDTYNEFRILDDKKADSMAIMTLTNCKHGNN